MKQITAFGDSIMRGIILDRKSATQTPRYTLLDENFSTRCSNQLGLTINNHGRFGNTTRHALRDLERRSDQVAASEYVVMEFGGNDCDFRWQEIADAPDKEHQPLTPLRSFAACYHELIAGVQRLGSQPVLLSLPPIVSESYFEAVTGSMDERQRKNVFDWLGGSLDNINRWHEMYNLELFKLANLLKTPIIDITSPFLRDRHHSNLFCDDGIHPNAAGHRLIAETICCYAQHYL